jgi:hypothetical protein
MFANGNENDLPDDGALNVCVVPGWVSISDVTAPLELKMSLELIVPDRVNSTSKPQKLE